MNHYRFSKVSIIAVILLTLLTCAPKPCLSSTSAASIPLTPTIVSPSPALPIAGADPVLYFSDITSGPKNGNSDISGGRSGMDGAIVTIWGRNLGSAQGGSRVYANGVEAASYYFWGNAAAPADLHTFHQMQMVSFQINHLAQDGLGSIYVVVNGKTSNALPFTVRAGSIYFVTTGGNDDTGDGSWGSPWLTIPYAANSLAAGDIAYIGDGVDQTTEVDYGAAVNLGNDGTVSLPKALIVYPGAVSNVGNATIERAFWVWNGNTGGYSVNWVLAKFTITTGQVGIPAQSGFRAVGNYITAPNGDGMDGAIGVWGNNTYILGNELENIGSANCSKLYHAIYGSGVRQDDPPRAPTEANREVAWNYLHDNLSNRGINIYSEQANSAFIQQHRVHDNVIVNQRGDGIMLGYYVTGNNWIYNNLIVNAGLGPEWSDDASYHTGIRINAGHENISQTAVYIYNNTLYGSGWSGAALPGETGSVLFDQGALDRSTTVDFSNNIIFSTGEPYLAGESAALPNGDYLNCWYGDSIPPAWDIAAINDDPAFVSASAFNFQLQNDSPCMDAGKNIGTVVMRDLLGAPRPQGIAFDIGAYEYITGTVTILPAIFLPLIIRSAGLPMAIPSLPDAIPFPTIIIAQTTAETYYVDPVNGDDEHSGISPQDAWRTLRNVYSYRADHIPSYAVPLEPGDTIYLMDGVHSTIYRPGDDSGPGNGRPAVMRFRAVHGTQAEPIRLLAYPGHHPVIDPDYQGEGVYILDSSWLEIGGIEFRDAKSQGEGGNIAIVTSSHIEIHDVEVHEAVGADDDNISGLNATDVWDLEIYNCSFHDNYDRNAADTGGISTHNSTNMVFFLGGNISVHDCLIYQSPIGDDMNLVNSGMGIKYKHASADPAAYFHVYNNIFRNNKYWALLSGTANTHFHHNIIIGGSGLGAGSEDCGGPTHQTNQVYEYNTFYQVYSEDRQYSAGGFYFYPTTEWRSADFPADPSQIVFRRNIVYDDQGYWTERATTNIYPYISDEVYNATAPNLKFDDNCFYNPNYDLRFSFAAGENQGGLGGFYTFGEWQALTWVDPSNGQTRTLGYDAHSVAANPQFALVDLSLNSYDQASNAFRPALGSSCGAMGAYAGLAMPNQIYLSLIMALNGNFDFQYSIRSR